MVIKKRKIKVVCKAEISFSPEQQGLFVDGKGRIYLLAKGMQIIHCFNEDGTVHHTIDLKQYEDKRRGGVAFYGNHIYVGIEVDDKGKLLCLNFEGKVIGEYQFESKPYVQFEDELHNLVVEESWRVEGQLLWRTRVTIITPEGKEKWQYPNASFFCQMRDLIILYNDKGELVAHQFEDGEIRWTINFNNYSVLMQNNSYHDGYNYLIRRKRIESPKDESELKIVGFNYEGLLKEGLTLTDISIFNSYILNKEGMMYLIWGRKILLKVNLSTQCIEQKYELTRLATLDGPIIDQEGNICLFTYGKGTTSYFEVYTPQLEVIDVKKLRGEAEDYILHPNGKVYSLMEGRTRGESYIAILELR